MGGNLFVTSRSIPEIIQKFAGGISLEIYTSNKDVRLYLDNRLSQLPAFVRRDPKLQDDIKTEIVKTVDGMFLLAQLHLDSLIAKRSPRAVKTALKTLPNGYEAHDHVYNAAIERIEGQVANSRELVEQILSWSTYAKRPLTTAELCHTLTVEIHYTAKQYFERTQRFRFPNAEAEIARTCLTYLSFDAFESGFCPTDEEFEARLRSNVLYDYAARNWGHHMPLHWAAENRHEALVKLLLVKLGSSGNYHNAMAQSARQTTLSHSEALVPTRNPYTTRNTPSLITQTILGVLQYIDASPGETTFRADRNGAHLPSLLVCHVYLGGRRGQRWTVNQSGAARTEARQAAREGAA
ncbi:hypothetical protein EAF00_008580 [Botryotinia globosa]|nr:hypothetical protein EAF00_008580 [Botryotinia globosa]